MEGEFGPQRVNVSDQRGDLDSPLWWIRTLIERYRECPELAWDDYEILEPASPRCSPTGAGSTAARS